MGNYRLLAFSFLLAGFLSASCKHSDNDNQGFSDEEIKAGGEATVFISSSMAFSTPAPNLTSESLEKHLKGDVNFEDIFVTAPAQKNSGLGPVFNNNSCISCHVKDGRGVPVFDDGTISSLLIRISNGEPEQKGGPHQPVSGFGNQIQHRAVYGVEPEADIQILYEFIQEVLDDGEKVQLRKPTYNLANPHTSLPSTYQLSPRVAPTIIGMGLLEAIPENDILAYADEDDLDGDGISGKPNYVWNSQSGEYEIGRYGWKANEPTVMQQVAGAYRNDMGITSPYFSTESFYEYPEADDHLDDDPEISQQTLDETTFYAATLGVPAVRNVSDELVKHGKQIFTEAGCVNCHVPKHRTGISNILPELSNQTIYPYTDLLLHDMGEGLADNRKDFSASGTEWKTPALWGIGLTEVVNGHHNFLHDGRARSLLEAIMWHGGEAESAKNYVKALSREDRDALIAFIKAI